jgi:beta-lactamase class A
MAMRRTAVPTMICLLTLSVTLGAQTSPGSRLATAAVRTPGLDSVRWASLKKNVSRVLGEFTGTVGLVVKDLATGREIRLNENRLFPAASMVKVPVMAACFKAVEDGRLALEDALILKASDKVRGSGHLRTERSGTPISVQGLLEIMVTESDNTAANMLIDRLGGEALDASFADLGLVQTKLARKMMDFRSRRNGVENYTTPGEMAGLFEKIYGGTCFGPAVSQSCLTLLKAQKVNNRISRYLPRTVEFAHKTGLELTVCHDAGILYTKHGNVLVCVLTEGDTGAIIAGRWIGRLGKVIYGAYK